MERAAIRSLGAIVSCRRRCGCRFSRTVSNALHLLRSGASAIERTDNIAERLGQSISVGNGRTNVQFKPDEEFLAIARHLALYVLERLC